MKRYIKSDSIPKYKIRDDYNNADDYRKAVLRKQFENNRNPYKEQANHTFYTDEQLAEREAASMNWENERRKYMDSKNISVTGSDNLTDIYTLEVVPECNDEDDQPTCWALASQFEDERGRHDFIWITKYDDKEYIIEDSNGHSYAHGRTYKTLKGAWKEAARIMERRDESGTFAEI